MNIGTRVMAHRYLYYVKAAPVISDYDYDQLESEARAVLPPDHPVHGVGSDREMDYPAEIVVAAVALIAEP